MPLRRNSLSLNVIPEMVNCGEDEVNFFCTPRKHRPKGQLNYGLHKFLKMESHKAATYDLSEEDLFLKHPSLNTVLSGMFDSGALRTPAHSFNVSSLMAGQPLQNSASSAALLSDPAHSAAPPLRKSSSAADWSGTISALGSKTPSFQHLSDLAGYESGRTSKSFNHQLNGPVSALPAHLQDSKKKGGLVMSSSPELQNNKQMMPVSSQLSTTPFSQHIASSSASPASSHANTPLNPLDPHSVHHDDHAKQHGMFGSMFKGGFFARPVVRTEEENYRYLMALDR